MLLRTERPSFENSGAVRLAGGTDGRLDGGFKVTGALIPDVLAGRLSVHYKSVDGYYRNRFDGPQPGVILGREHELSGKFGENETRIIRPSLRWTPTEAATIDLIAEFSDTEGDGGVAFTAIRTGMGLHLPDLDGDAQDIVADTDGINEYDYTSVVLDANWDTGNGTFTWLSGYREMDQYNVVDADGAGEDIFVFLSNPIQEQFTQEARWSGTPFSDAVETTLGVYYFWQEVDYLEGRHIFADLLGSPFLQGLGGIVDHDAIGVFGAVNWQIAPQWALNVGLRWTDEEKEADITVGSTCDAAARACDFGFNDSEQWSNLSPSVTVQYFSSEDTQWYGSYRRGFRSGGFNIRNSSAFVVSPKYDEEVVDSFEVGMKSDFSDSLRLNVALFHATFDDLQRIVVQPDASQRVQNAAKARFVGAEIEAFWRVTERFSLSGNLGIQDGEYKDLDPGGADRVQQRARGFPPGSRRLPAPGSGRVPAAGGEERNACGDGRSARGRCRLPGLSRIGQLPRRPPRHRQRLQHGHHGRLLDGGRERPLRLRGRPLGGDGVRQEHQRCRNTAQYHRYRPVHHLQRPLGEPLRA